MLRRFIYCLLLACFTMPGFASADDGPLAPVPAAVKASVQKGLAFLEKEGIAWYEGKSCLSCHHTTYQVWTHREAQRRGIPVEQKKIDEWVGWCVELAEPKGGNDVLALLLNVLSRDMVPPGEAQKKLESVPAKIMGFQKPDGSWATSGQFHVGQWPVPEADESATRLMLLGLSSPWADAEKTRASRERALAWLKTRDEQAATNAPQSTWTHANRLLYALKTNDTVRQSRLCEALISQQKADGGWARKISAEGKDSDPITTGEVLYMLNAAGAKGMETAGPRAVAYLLKAQREDGAWYQDHRQVSSKIRTEKNPKVDGIYTYWATAWATLSLVSTV